MPSSVNREATTKIKILLVGEATVPTGYSRVLRSIFQYLHDKFEIHQLATRYDGDPHDYPWPLYPAGIGGDAYGYNRLPALIERIQPDIVFILYDLSFQTRYMDVLRQIRGSFRVVIYSPVESGPITPEIVERLQGVSRCAVFTRYGADQMMAALEHLRMRRPDFVFPVPEIVPHGLDSEVFRPLGREGSVDEARLEARRRLFPGQTELLDAFIVLNANRNQPRKQIDITMKGFAQFANGKSDKVKLYLHMGVEDRGWNVILLAQRLGIADRLILTTDGNAHPNLPGEQLNLLYNACDVGLNTSSGEGWGLVSFEHAATGAAQIVPRHTSQIELWQDAALWAEPVMTLTNTGILNEAYIVSPESVANALEWLYSDPALRAQMAGKAYENAHNSEYRWERIADQWERIFRLTV